MPVNVFGGGNSIFNRDVSMNGNRITDIGLPVEENDAANKGYVDSKFQANEPWLLEGNVLTGTGTEVLGSTNDNDFEIVRDNIIKLSFKSNRITCNDDLFFLNPTGSESGDPEPEGDDESTAATIRFFGITNLGASKEFKIFLGNNSNYMSWQNNLGQPIRYVCSSGIYFKKGNNNLFFFGNTNTCYKNLSMNVVNRITDLADPINAQDASTRAYVDLTSNLHLLLNGGTMRGIINMGDYTITNLGYPVNLHDATNKDYVDSRHDLQLNLTGGSMSGSINMSGNNITNLATPNSNNDAANKFYVDQKVSKIGDTMFGNLNMLNNYITNVANPINIKDVSNKEYTDTKVSINGGFMLGELDMSNHKIINVANPTSNFEVVNKITMDFVTAQYLPLGVGIMNGAIDINGYRVPNIVDPVNPQDAATKNYVDTWKSSIVSVNANFTINNTHLNKTIQVTGAGITITLSNTVTSDFTCKIMQMDTNTSTITGLNTSCTINPNQTLGNSSIQSGVLYTIYGTFIKRELITASPHFWGYYNAGFFVNSGSNIPLPINTSKTNVGGGLIFGTGRFVSPIEGLYRFNSLLTCAAPQNNTDVMFTFVNQLGTEYVRGTRMTVSAAFNVTNNATVYLNKGDQIGIAIYVSRTLTSEGGGNGIYGIVFQGSLEYPG